MNYELTCLDLPSRDPWISDVHMPQKCPDYATADEPFPAWRTAIWAFFSSSVVVLTLVEFCFVDDWENPFLFAPDFAFA